MFGPLCPTFVIILLGKNELVALLQLSSRCLLTVSVLLPLLMVLWVGLRCVTVFFSDHTHLFFSLGDDIAGIIAEVIVIVLL